MSYRYIIMHKKLLYTVYDICIIGSKFAKRLGLLCSSRHKI